MSAPRFPLEPLAAALDIELGRPGGSKAGQAPRGLVHFAELADVSLSTAKRWHRHGIPEADADRLATHLVGHPVLVWPDYGDLPVIDEAPPSLFDEVA